MKIATYNINSIKAHAVSFFSWLKKNNPDIVLLQEIKCDTENFLYFECESLGYKVAVLGQKSYNGVAILSKFDFTITSRNLPNFVDDASRYLEILVTTEQTKFYIASIYAPNGCAPDKNVEKEKLKYKLNWFDALYERIRYLSKTSIPIIIGGDFNVMMQDIDAYDIEKFINSPLYKKDVRNKIYALNYLGLYDSYRLLDKKNEAFTFWDYTANSFVTNSGLRIDYLFISSYFAERLEKCVVDRKIREMDKTSDHTTLVAEFKDF